MVKQWKTKRKRHFVRKKIKHWNLFQWKTNWEMKKRSQRRNEQKESKWKKMILHAIFWWWEKIRRTNQKKPLVSFHTLLQEELKEKKNGKERERKRERGRKGKRKVRERERKKVKEKNSKHQSNCECCDTAHWSSKTFGFFSLPFSSDFSYPKFVSSLSLFAIDVSLRWDKTNIFQNRKPNPSQKSSFKISSFFLLVLKKILFMNIFSQSLFLHSKNYLNENKSFSSNHISFLSETPSQLSIHIDVYKPQYTSYT